MDFGIILSKISVKFIIQNEKTRNSTMSSNGLNTSFEDIFMAGAVRFELTARGFGVVIISNLY